MLFSYTQNLIILHLLMKRVKISKNITNTVDAYENITMKL